MKKLIYEITEDDKTEIKEFITNRTPEWTEKQYMRNRFKTKMKLIKKISYGNT